MSDVTEVACPICRADVPLSGTDAENEVRLGAHITSHTPLEIATRFNELMIVVSEGVRTIQRAHPVIAYVSAGRGYVGVQKYPDALARQSNAELDRWLGMAAATVGPLL